MSLTRNIPRSRGAPCRAAVWLAALLALGGVASAGASLQRHVSTTPSAKPARGGGPQTGTGTSDAVRSIIPPKNRG
jgi:hypothetical protein